VKPDDEVMFSYSAPSNISFHGRIGSGYSRAEWDEMSDVEQDEVMTEAVWRLIDMDVVEKP
jgi:hypothetical protein